MFSLFSEGVPSRREKRFETSLKQETQLQFSEPTNISNIVISSIVGGLNSILIRGGGRLRQPAMYADRGGPWWVWTKRTEPSPTKPDPAWILPQAYRGRRGRLGRRGWPRPARLARPARRT
jgi:hypothetical protein